MRLLFFASFLLGCGDDTAMPPRDAGLEERRDTGPLPRDAGLDAQPTAGDGDGDGVPDASDNCIDVPNPDQAITPPNPLGDACMWPSATAPANSDPWIAAHHDDLRRMAPRVLVLSFANGIGLGGNDNVDGGPVTEAMLRQQAQDFLDALALASTDESDEPFLAPVIDRVVDLQDENGHANSDLFPRGAVSAEGYPLVGYQGLFSEAFAAHLGYDGLTLGEAAAQGRVHDVIMIANQVDGRAPNPPDQVTRNILEVALVMQAYDGDFLPLDGRYVRNGCPQTLQQSGFEACDNSMAWPGVSLRIYFLNVSRGIGCLLHSLGHALEWTHNESVVHAPGAPEHGEAAVPWLRPYFRDFADFDLNWLGAPFLSLYAGGDDYSYEDCESGACTTLVHPRGRVTDYRTSCGNVHYPPGAAHGYDYYPAATVRSDCTTFMQPASTHAPLAGHPWSALTIDDDCGGRFLAWWLAQMPGLGTTAVEPGGAPMKNWWPFLYY